jgi:uncharacterized protein with PIN domain
MVLDTSAIVAAIANEPDGTRFQQAMLGSAPLTISSITVLETRTVLQSRHGDEAVREFDEMLENAGIGIVPIVPPMRWQKSEANRCFLRVAISASPIYSRRCDCAYDDPREGGAGYGHHSETHRHPCHRQARPPHLQR